ncbi:MAG TPA: hypothetical protein VGC39_00090 [Candidatus Methylacidiphilales bacterium]
MNNDTEKNNKGRVPVPDSLIEIFATRARWEEAKLDEIKVAYDAGDKEKVFKLSGELLYEGPGTVDKQPAPPSKPKSV